MLPEVEPLGPPMENGQQRPTRGLVETYRQFLDAGLAPPSAPHLYRKAHPITEAAAHADRRVRRGAEMLEEYVDPNSRSLLSAVGMAYPQLAQAKAGSKRIIAINVGMPDLRAESRQTETAVLYTPTVTPVRNAGFVDRVEYCFSAPGLGVVVRRWKVVMLELPGYPPRRVDGTDAWILQHETDHLDGILCVRRALQQSRPIYYVPPEWQRVFSRTTDRSMWPVFPVEQWRAMMNGQFDIARYERYL